MTSREIEPHGPRPVAMGCTLAVMSIVLAVIAVGACIRFAESGADTGKLTLRDSDSYDFDTFEFIQANNFFLTRTPTGKFYALLNLDAANRLESSGQCRVNLVHPGDPAHDALANQYRARFSGESAGSETLFREGCYGATYDLAGVRLDQDGRNLDQYAVSVDRQGRIVIDIARRVCTSREGAEIRVSGSC